MTTSTIVAIGLLMLLLGIGFAFAWQERRPSPELAVIYGTEDALEFIVPRLAESTRSALRRSDVRRILEWEMLYLQDTDHPDGSHVIVGGLEAAEFAQRKALEQGHGYNAEAIIDVLDRQAEYLAALGAIGAPVASDEVEAIMAAAAGDATEDQDPASEEPGGVADTEGHE